MRRRALIAACACGLAIAGLGAAPAPAAHREVQIAGSTTMVPVVADLAFFYRRSVRHPPRFVLNGGGTQVGISDAARGIVDVGLVGRALEPGDPPGLVLTPLAFSGVCLVTHPSNPIPGLTRGQVQDLVAGRLTSWAQVPGSRRVDPIAAVAPAAGTGMRTVFEETLTAPGTPLAYRPLTFVSISQVRAALLGLPAAWGYVDLAAAAGLHAVPLDGIPCTRATVASGAYPARRVLSFGTRGRPRGETARFIRWARTSPTARRIVGRRFVLPPRG